MAETFTIGRVDPSATPTSLSDVEFGFRQGYVFELVELSEPQRAIETFVFPIAPRLYTLDEPHALTITPTQGNSVVTEEFGSIIREITIEGTFGLTKKRASSYQGAQAGGNPISGNEHFRLLRNLFRRYYALKQDPIQGPRTQMRFHSLREDDHWIVVPRSFSTPRDAKSTRVHYDYRISLAAVGVVDDVLAPRTVSSETNAFKDALRDISKALNDARGFFADLNVFLTNDVQRGVFGNLQAVMLNAGSVINAVSNFLRTGAGFINIPFQFAVNVCAQLEQLADDFEQAALLAPLDETANAARNMRKLESSFERICAWHDRFEQNWNNRVRTIESAFAGERRITQRDVLDGTAGATAGTRTRVAYGSEGDAGLSLGNYSAVISVTVTRTDSLRSLAERYGVPPELIIVINDLAPPYFTEAGGAGTLGPGDEVLIPVADAGDRDTGAVVGSGYLPADVLLYGRDLAIDMDLYDRTGIFDLKVDVAHGALDAETVGGIPNVVQGTLITVETERGSTVYLPDIGVRRSVGTKGTLNHVILAALNFREAILSDPRIEAIESSEVLLDGDVLSQNMTARLVSRRTAVSLVRPIGRVSGGS
jgi:hypothetical protein